ncbi:hypothetical protein Z043_121746 [Scleropages formosus]|uniref:Histone H4 n=1 Tax=Scleropages formosus TaxID=113540 RepID=A0A0N8JW89_SCLFO|nr:hypothetical protein Z043_121746 [Scleropages formosus]
MDRPFVVTVYLSDLTYEETRGVPKVFLDSVIHDAVTCTDHAKTKTITATDDGYCLCISLMPYGFSS